MSGSTMDDWPGEGPCPRCGGPVPNAEHEGEYPGALSRTTRGPDDQPVEVCSACGSDEAMEEARGELTPQREWPVEAEEGPA